MSLLQDVLEWSKGLPAWESDAVRRLFEKEKLSEADLEDVLALLKAANGIPDTSGRTAKPLAEDEVPVPPADGAGTVLTAIRNVLHANAIAPGQQLAFKSVGLTVIYGENGSGKSGYSRILKRACRARDRSERVLGNAFLPVAERGVPEAEFEFAVEGATKIAPWAYKIPCDPALSAIAVFDQHCARTYLDDEHDVSYIPYGLGILIELARALGEIKTRLTVEQKLYEVNKADFADLAGETAVGRLVANLSTSTTPESVERLASLSEEETTKRADLEKALRESDPKGKAKNLGLLKDQLFQLGTSLSTSEKALANDALLEIRGTVEALAASREAAKFAASELTGQEELLQGTGGVAWKELFKAAKKFSETEAYREKAFPMVSDGSRCVLCQQALEEGGPRMSRFSAFIQAETEQAVVKTEKAAKDATVKLVAVKPESALADRALLAITGTLQEGLPDQIRAFVASMAGRQKEILAALESGTWPALADLSASPVDALRAIYGKIKTDIAELLRVAEDKERKNSEAELKELDARFKLSGRKSAVLAALDKYLMSANLVTCIRAADTTGISGRITAFQKKWLTADLSVALNLEFEKFGANHLKVVFTSRTSGGTPVQKLNLNLPGDGKDGDGISTILSEGEQRVLALASFLAEASLTHSKSGLVFDDPVSSLDHRYRQKVADRLVEVAATRQVVVFTHDIAFLFYLQEACKTQQGATFSAQYLTGNDKRFGFVKPDLPFEGRTLGARIQSLKEMHAKARNFYDSADIDEYTERIRSSFTRLRETWERMVEEGLFKDTVKRFSRNVETMKLRYVTVEDEDFKMIHTAMAYCSRYAHDTARELQQPVPPPQDFLAAVDHLEAYSKSVIARGNAVEKVRSAMIALPAGSN